MRSRVASNGMFFGKMFYGIPSDSPKLSGVGPEIIST
jgi:hypothetical protein